MLAIAFCGLMAAGCSSQRSASQVDPAVEAAVRSAIESGQFTIEVHTAMPRWGGSISLVHPFQVTLDATRVDSQLPYFGRSFSAVPIGWEGLRFEGHMTRLRITDGRNGSKEIRFMVRAPSDTYDFRISVFMNGNSSITVMPMRRQSIDFLGRLVLEEPPVEAVPVHGNF
jgi:hypothetical protein